MEYITAENGVGYFRSPKIPVPHGFSTRVGGVGTTLPYTATLNLAYGRGDDDAVVRENLSRFCEAICGSGINPENVISVGQIHSADVIYCSQNERGLGYYRKTDFCCDGYYTKEREVVLGVKTADCVPVLFYAVGDGITAVGAVHSGWRGTVKNIASVCVGKLLSLGGGIKPERIVAAIGPSIGRCCFEVESDAVGLFRDAFGDEFCGKFIRPDGDRAGKYFPDLCAMIKYQLLTAGIAEENIDFPDEGICTSCRPELFYSHRRDGQKRGTMLSLITLP